MNFQVPGPNNLDFSPTNRPINLLASFVAETTIVRIIVEGSGGPENAEMTEPGLRFIRYLLARSNSESKGSLPNFKDMESIQEAARSFINSCGNASTALQIMYNAMRA